METKTDSSGNSYVDVGNIRLTLVGSASAPEYWTGHDCIRINAYRGAENNALHQGAMIPLSSRQTIVELIEALCHLYRITPESK